MDVGRVEVVRDPSLHAENDCSPMHATIVGVDLLPIKPIRNVTCFKEDITTEKCRAQLTKHLKGQMADVVLHDGKESLCNLFIILLFSSLLSCLTLVFLLHLFRMFHQVLLTWARRGSKTPISRANLY